MKWTEIGHISSGGDEFTSKVRYSPCCVECFLRMLKLWARRDWSLNWKVESTFVVADKNKNSKAIVKFGGCLRKKKQKKRRMFRWLSLLFDANFTGSPSNTSWSSSGPNTTGFLSKFRLPESTTNTSTGSGTKSAGASCRWSGCHAQVDFNFGIKIILNINRIAC